MNSHHAPDYCRLSSIVKEAIEIIERLLDPTDPLNDQAGIENRLREIRQLSLGSLRMVKARQVLYEIYDHSMSEPERERDIDELLWFFQDYSTFIEDEDYNAERNVTRYKIKGFLGDILSPFDELVMDWEDAFEYSRNVYKRMLELNMLTEGEIDESGQTTVWINEPDHWG